MKHFSLLLVLLLPAGSFAQKIEVPEKVVAEPCKFVTITATSDGQVRWFPLSEELDVLPQKLIADSKTIVVIAPRAGTYRILAYTAKGDIPSAPAICTLVVMGDVPDIPPPPPPPPVGFEGRLRQAFETDQGKDKINTLIEVWRFAPKVINNKEVTTTKELVALIKSVESDSMGESLPGTRAVMWAEFNSYFSENFILTTPQRENMTATVEKMTKVLEKIP